MSKLLKFARHINKPLVRFMIVKGWGLRLIKKRLSNGYKFRKLTSEEKKEIKRFWRGYGKNVSTKWCSYFSYGSGIIDKRYIPESLYYGEILQKLNNQILGPGLSDKNIQSVLFKDIQPEVVFRKVDGILLDKNWNEINLDVAFRNSEAEKNVVIKKTRGSYGGAGVLFWNRSQGRNTLEKMISGKDDLIIQSMVQQHPFFESIHPTSLNTLRIVTLILEKEPILLSTMLRMGRSGSKVDNYTAGGVICPVDKQGFLFPKAVQKNQSVITSHPDGFVFAGKRIPYFDSIIDEAKRLHLRVPYFKLVSWDFSVSVEGKPLLIEGNYPSSQLDLHQLNIGSIFGEHTDKVLSEVYGNYQEEDKQQKTLYRIKSEN